MREASWQRWQLVAAALIVAALGCGSSEREPTVNVGLLLPFTGEVGAMGINLEEAAMMVADRVNQHGGLHGKKMKLVVADTHSNVERALTSLDQILAENPLAIVGPESADVAVAILPVLKQRQILFVSPYGTDSIASSDADSSYPWFRLAATPAAQGQALAKRMVADHRARVAILYTTDLYNSALAEEAATTLARLGSVTVAQVALPARHEDYSDELARVGADDLRVLLLAADPISGANIVNDVSILFPATDRHWYFSPTLKTTSFVTNAFPEKIEGGIGVAPTLFGSVDDFQAAFTAAWNGDTPLDGAYYYYDALAVVALAIERASVAAGSQEPSFATLSDSVRAVARTFGTVTDWNRLDVALDLVRSGQTAYYTGLSGPILLDSEGVRQMGTAAFWQISHSTIVDLN